MQVKVLSAHFEGGEVGDVVEVDPATVNVRALVKAKLVAEVAADPEPEAPARKAKAKPARPADTEADS